MNGSFQALRNEADNKVIFSAIRKRNDVRGKGTITFDELVINEKSGFDAGRGIFTTPVSGVYAFSFSAWRTKGGNQLYVRVYKNSAAQFDINDRLVIGNHDEQPNLSYSWMMDLRRGDRVNLVLNAGGALPGGLRVNGDNFIWFNGHLLLSK